MMPAVRNLVQREKLIRRTMKMFYEIEGLFKMYKRGRKRRGERLKSVERTKVGDSWSQKRREKWVVMMSAHKGRWSVLQSPVAFEASSAVIPEAGFHLFGDAPHGFSRANCLRQRLVQASFSALQKSTVLSLKTRRKTIFHY